MLSNINTKKNDLEKLEETIEKVYNNFEGKVDQKYIELWNAFVELIEFIQNNFDNSKDDISPTEAINLMKELGFSNDDMKSLIVEGIKSDNTNK